MSALTQALVDAGFSVRRAEAIETAIIGSLPDVSEGTWTPVLTFATPGDLTVSYTLQAGSYQRTGNMVHAAFQILTSTFTHSTASGTALITGLPFSSSSSFVCVGPLRWQGITKANYTDMATRIAPGENAFAIAGSGSGQSFATLAVGDLPSGGSVSLTGSAIYPTT